MLRVYVIGLIVAVVVVAGGWYVVRARPDARLRAEEDALEALRASLPRAWDVPRGTGESPASLALEPRELEDFAAAYAAYRTAKARVRSGVDAETARRHLPVEALLALDRRSIARVNDADVETLAGAMRGALSVLNHHPEAFGSALRLGRAFDLTTSGSDAVLSPDPFDSPTPNAARSSPHTRHRFGGWERWVANASWVAVARVHEENADPTPVAELLRELAESRQAPRSVVLRFVEDVEHRAVALRTRLDERLSVGMTDSFERELQELRISRERAARWSARRAPFAGAGTEIEDLRAVDALEFASDELATRFLLAATRAAALAAHDKDHANAHVASERDPCVGEPLRLVDGDIVPSEAGRRCLDALRAAAGRPEPVRFRFYEPTRVGGAVIRLHIRACTPRIQGCFRTEARSDPDAGGRVVARIVVDDSLPNDVTLETSGRFSERFQRCVREELESCPIQPAQRMGNVNVTYPFYFAQH